MAENVTITVPVTGTCPQGHSVAANMTATVRKGGAGVATGTANCGACGSPVSMSGPFSA